MSADAKGQHAAKKAKLAPLLRAIKREIDNLQGHQIMYCTDHRCCRNDEHPPAPVYIRDRFEKLGERLQPFLKEGIEP